MLDECDSSLTPPCVSSKDVMLLTEPLECTCRIPRWPSWNGEKSARVPFQFKATGSLYFSKLAEKLAKWIKIVQILGVILMFFPMSLQKKGAHRTVLCCFTPHRPHRATRAGALHWVAILWSTHLLKPRSAGGWLQFVNVVGGGRETKNPKLREKCSKHSDSISLIRPLTRFAFPNASNPLLCFNCFSSCGLGPDFLRCSSEFIIDSCGTTKTGIEKQPRLHTQRPQQSHKNPHHPLQFPQKKKKKQTTHSLSLLYPFKAKMCFAHRKSS